MYLHYRTQLTKSGYRCQACGYAAECAICNFRQGRVCNHHFIGCEEIKCMSAARVACREYIRNTDFCNHIEIIMTICTRCPFIALGGLEENPVYSKISRDVAANHSGVLDNCGERSLKERLDREIDSNVCSSNMLMLSQRCQQTRFLSQSLLVRSCLALRKFQAQT
jgi:hypothetical protein